MGRSAVAQKGVGRYLGVDDAASSGHPLHTAGTRNVSSACRVPVGQRAFLDEGEGLEPYVGVRSKRQARIAGRVGLRSMVVQEQKGIQVGQGNGRERHVGSTAHQRVRCGQVTMRSEAKGWPWSPV